MSKETAVHFFNTIKSRKEIDMTTPHKKRFNMRTPKEKEKIILEYLNGRVGYRTVADNHNIAHELFRIWVKKYQESGIEGLRSQTGRHKGSNKGRPKKRTEIEELKRELAKKDIIIERLKKGYAVKGVGAKKEYVTTFDKNTK